GAPGYLVDVVCKRSTDGGATWNSYTVLAHKNSYDYFDPRPVVDASTGKIVLVVARCPDGAGSLAVPSGVGDNSAQIYTLTSANNGQTWTSPANITSQVKDPSWSMITAGAGAGIQLRWQTDSARNGRIVTPGFIRNEPTGTYSFKNLSFYSDDGGVNWSHSPCSSVYADESQIVELTNGDLLLDGRQKTGSYRTRWISHDGGATWGSMYTGDLPVTQVNCSLTRYSAKRDGDDRDRLIFSAPLGDPVGSANGRTNMAVWTSYDEGKTFINPVQVASGFGAYSSMQVLADGSIGLLYEKTLCTQIQMLKFGIADLEGQQFSSHLTHYDGFGNNIDRRRGGMGWSGSWIGNGVASNTYNSRLGSTGLSFAGSSAPTESGRMDLTPSHNTAKRVLATPVNLNTNATTYVSLLVSRALDASSDLSAKSLNIELRSANEAAQAAFGIGGNQEFYLSQPGQATVSTAAGAVDRNSTYLLVLKMVSQDSLPGNSDQLYLGVFRSGVDIVPSNDADLTWTLLGEADVNSSAIIDRIALTGAATASWSFDELRIGDSFAAVAGVYAPEPTSAALLLIGSAAVFLYWRPQLGRSRVRKQNGEGRTQ
ncbi:MAG: sialidase family protein, partial [Thermoguttaceae bacterium]